MTIHLPEDRERFVRSLVQEGRYASEAAVVDEALRLLEQRDSGPSPTPRVATPSDQPIWERILERTAEIPDEVWDKIPTDLAEQHDHYIYGTPKRTKA
jgi:Arc/MetJ-type ribon-helix-helix transcriptional regulator